MNAINRLLAINTGNTRTQLGCFHGDELERMEHFSNGDITALIQHVVDWWRSAAETGGDPQPAIVIASVAETVSEQIISGIRDQLAITPYVIGPDLPAPIGEQLDPETITGVDRLINAAAAFDRAKQACVVVDAGTAVTVDFVDGKGTFHGGAIAPGAQMQLDALHEHTDALPELTFSKPADEAFGRSTTQAMLQGVYHGIRGLVYRLVEQYALRFGAYPMVIATGGDAQVLFGEDELIDRIVPELTLMGIYAAARTALSVDSAAERDSDD